MIQHLPPSRLAMTNAQNNPQKPSNCYTLAELHQEIAKDEEWRTKFCYLPTVTKEGRGFYSDAELLIGVSKHDEETRVYAELYLATSGLYNLVAIKLPNDSIGTRQQQRGEAVPKLQHIKFLEPFDRLSDVGSRHWCQELRFLVSYYGLEQQAIDRCVFKKDGLEALKRACIHIADEAILWNEKPLRPLLIIPTTTHDTKTTTQLSTQEDYDDEETYFKQEESPMELGKVFENDQACAFSTTVHRDGNNSASRFPKTMHSHPNTNSLLGRVLAGPTSAHKPKRKRLPKKQATSEDEEQEDEDSELMVSRVIGS